jgi:hypothetical protein
VVIGGCGGRITPLCGRVAITATACLVGTSFRQSLARNGIATASASDTVLSRTMALSAHQLDISLEALTDLLYLVRRPLDDPARVEAYLDVADKVLSDIATRRRIAPRR